MKNINKYKKCNNKLSKLEYIFVYTSFVVSFIYCIYYLAYSYKTADPSVSGWIVLIGPLFFIIIVGTTIINYFLATKNLDKRSIIRLIFELIISISSVIIDYLFFEEKISLFIIIYCCLQIPLSIIIIIDLIKKNI